MVYVAVKGSRWHDATQGTHYEVLEGILERKKDVSYILNTLSLHRLEVGKRKLELYT